jgi:chromosome transmission fidelity protein 4
VIPKPVLSLLNLSFPVASSDLGADALENEFIMNSMHLSQVCLPPSPKKNKKKEATPL